MNTEEKLEKFQTFVNELNQGNMECIPTYIAEEFFTHIPVDDEPAGSAVYQDLFRDLKSGLPDLHVTLNHLEANGEQLQGQVTIKGTHTSALWNVPPTQKTAQWTVDIRAREVDGRFAINFDNVTVPAVLDLLRQLELVNPPDQMDRPMKHPVVIPEIIAKVLFTGQMADKPCGHLAQIRVTEPKTDVCEQCVASGDIWPALRMCLICGFTGCCDTSKNTHAKKHYEATGHSIFRSIRLNEGWIWCYEDNAFFTTRVLNKYRVKTD